MSDISLKKPCPKCKQTQVVITKNRIHCTKPGCDFDIAYGCPLCDTSLEQAIYGTDNQGPYYKCKGCGRIVHLRRIAYLIENSMIVDATARCSYCNSPTINRVESNIGSRCFYFPKCSGQANLFAAQTDSLVFLDFETTGLEAGRDSILEIGALKIDEEGFEETYQTFIKPPVDIPEKITSITGITADMVKDAPTIEEIFPEFARFIGKSIIVAHNSDFDLPWLQVAAKQLNVPIETKKVICTLKWARASAEGQCSLEALTKKYKISHSNAHRALADAAATKELFFIFKDLKAVPAPEIEISHYEETAEKLIARYNRIANV